MESLLFTPMDLRGVHLRNRIVVSPMLTYSAKNGFADDWHFIHYGRFATGGAGLIFVESTKADPPPAAAPHSTVSPQPDPSPAPLTPPAIPGPAAQRQEASSVLPPVWSIGFAVLLLRLAAARWLLWHAGRRATLLACDQRDPLLDALRAA